MYVCASLRKAQTGVCMLGVRDVQPCMTLCNPMDCSLPGSSVHKSTDGNKHNTHLWGSTVTGIFVWSQLIMKKKEKAGNIHEKFVAKSEYSEAANVTGLHLLKNFLEINFSPFILKTFFFSNALFIFRLSRSSLSLSLYIYIYIYIYIQNLDLWWALH